MEEVQTRQMRKRNMKLFPTYRKLAWDYIFFYTINFLFLTQIKGINPADIVLIDSFYYLFASIAQIPSTLIIEFLGRKNSMIFANILNCLYMVVIIFSKNLFNLIIAECLSSLAFAIKESAEPSLLNESIPPTKKKSEIFARISEKGMSSYYIINGIATILAGFLYEVNPYIPIILSLITLIIVTLLSTLFIEPVKKRKKKKVNLDQIKDIKESFQYILKSERIKSLILFSILMTGILGILSNYEISLLEDLDVSASSLGILFAILGITASIGTKKQDKIHKKYKNKSLTKIGLTLVGSCIISGIAGIVSKEYRIGIILIIVAYLVKYICAGAYYALIEKYLSNFTNKDIDTKIYTANNCIRSISSAVIGIMASFLLDRLETAYCMIIIGSIFAILMILVSKYMKTRVGLKPEEYSKEEVKYDKLKELV
ncbi:MAG: MFS transporter [Clostridia bacterium]